jgi:hypothetical protein
MSGGSTRVWLTEKEATRAREAGLPIKDTYLRDKRRLGGGPPHKYFGNKLLYNVELFEQWIREGAVSTTTWKQTMPPRPALPAPQ